MRLEDLVADQVVGGVVPGTAVTVVAVAWAGPDSVVLTYKGADGGLAQKVLYRADEAALSEGLANQRSFSASASDFKLAAEAQRIRLAGIYDPMLAVSTSDVQPLPHQITAVYEELLPRVPLRFLLADDPGAVGLEFKQISDEILSHLRANPSTRISIHLEIEATDPTGFTDAQIRTVSENATVLKFEQFGFEES